MKLIIALAFLAVAAAETVKVANIPSIEVAPRAPVEAVRVVDTPIYVDTDSVLRASAPVESVRVVDSPVEVEVSPVESVKVVDTPAAPAAAETVKVVDMPVPSVPIMMRDAVKVAEYPRV